MSNENKTTENEKEVSALENIKLLSVLTQGENEFVVLQKNIREAKKLIDGMFKYIRDGEKQKNEEIRAQREAKEAEEAKIAQVAFEKEQAIIKEQQRVQLEKEKAEFEIAMKKESAKTAESISIEKTAQPVSADVVAEKTAPTQTVAAPTAPVAPQNSLAATATAATPSTQPQSQQSSQPQQIRRPEQSAPSRQRVFDQNQNQNRPQQRPPYGQNGTYQQGGYQGQGQGQGYNNNYQGQNQGQGGYQQRPQYNNQGQGRPYQGGAQGQSQGQRTYVPNQQGQTGPRTYVPNQNQGTRPPYQQGQNQNRFGQSGPRPFGPRPTTSVAPNIVSKPTTGVKVFDPQQNKKKEAPKIDDKKSMNKRTLIRKGFIEDVPEEERMGTRKLKNKKVIKNVFAAPIKIEKAIITTDNLTVKILSEKIGKPATEIIKQLMTLGIMTNINSVVDFATMELVANELGIELELKLDKTKVEILEESHDTSGDEAENLEKRPPIVTVMGHVDHGKTSLLDTIRSASVATGEAGGITQHIGAYSINVHGEKITFIDTPGHEAFTAMRARGAKVTDISILVVAADDGIMPQTIEAINHSKAAKVPLIVAINKMDKPGATTDKIIQRLTEHEILAEEWGGDTIIVPVSAKTGFNIDKLLESVLLVAEVQELKANSNRKAKGTIIEASLDKGKGALATIIVQNGTLHVGDTVVSGMAYGRIRAMIDDKGRNVKTAGPSMAVSVLGFNEVPNAGDIIHVVEDEKLAKQVATERADKVKASQSEVSQAAISFDDVMNKISETHLKEFNIIIKADTQGSVEAIKSSLAKLSNDEVRVNIIHGGAGSVNKSDIMLAGASGARIIAFNVRPDNESKALAEETKVNLKQYRIIYEAIEDIEAAIKGLEEPKYSEEIIGHAEIRNVFKLSNSGTIAGLYVKDGKLQRGCDVKIMRGNDVIHTGTLTTLRRFKDDVKEVGTNYECGMGLDGFADYKELDMVIASIKKRIN